MDKSRKPLVLMAVALLVGASLLAACGGGGAASGTVVNVKLTEYKIELDRTSVPAGPVTFRITNTGSITHEVVLEPAGANDEPLEANNQESEAENIEAGKTATLVWTLDTPGEYQLGCHLPGHFEAGMVTTFTVTTQ